MRKRRGARRAFATAAALAVSLAPTGCFSGIAAGVILGTQSSSHHATATTPLVSLINPATGPHAGGTPITITGANFAPNAKVTIGGAAAINVSVGDGATLICTTPRSSTVGPADVVVQNPDGGSGALTAGFVFTNGAAVAVVETITSPQAGAIVLSFSLAQPASDLIDVTVDVTVEPSPDPIGAEAYVVSGDLLSLTSSPKGTVHTITLDSRQLFANKNAAGVRIRVTPKDVVDGKVGTAGISNPFSIANNAGPLLRLIQNGDDSFDVVVSYVVTDPDPTDTLSVEALRWSDLSSGRSGRMTLSTLTTSQGEVPIPGAATSGLTVQSVWDSLTDLGYGNNRLVTVTVSVSDGKNPAVSQTSKPFFVSNGPLSDQRANSLFQRPDGIAVGDVTSDSRPDVVTCRGGSSIDQQGRIVVTVNQGQAYGTALTVDAPAIAAIATASPYPSNPFLSRVAHPTECAILDANGDSKLDLVAAEAFNAPNTSVTPLLDHLATVLSQCNEDAGGQFVNVIAHQQTLRVPQAAGALDFSAAGTLYETSQAPRTRMAPLVRAAGQPPSTYPRPATGDPALDNLGWFAQALVAADLDSKGAPGGEDLVIVHGVARLGDALAIFGAGTSPVTSGVVVIRQASSNPPPPGLAQPGLGLTFFLDPTDMGVMPTHVAVADVLSSSRTPGYMGLGATAPEGSPDLIVANTGDDSLTFYFQVAPAPTPGTTAPTYASFRLQLTSLPGLSSLPLGDTIGVAIGDLNGDGANDFIVVGQSSQTVLVFVYDPDPTAPGSLVTATFGFLPFRLEGLLLLPSLRAGRPAIADVSGDGRLDIVVPLQLTNEVVVLLNTTAAKGGRTSFAPAVRFAAGFAPYQAIARDVNGDLRADIVTANGLSQDFSVFLQTSQGRLDDRSIPIASGISPLIARAGGVIGAVTTEVVVTMSGENSVHVYSRDPVNVLTLTRTYSFAGLFGGLTASSPFDVQLADVTGDGIPDLLVAMEVVVASGGATTGGVAIIPGGASASGIAMILTGTGGPIGFSAAAGDLAGTGLATVVLTENQADTATIYSQVGPVGALAFAAPASRAGPVTQVIVVDVDGDGLPDIVLGTGLPRLAIYYNGGKHPKGAPGFLGVGQFSAAPDHIVDLTPLGNSVGVESAILTTSGLRDFIVTGFTSSTAGILFQTAARTDTTDAQFTLVPLPVGGKPSQIAVGDLDGDGRPDIAIPWGNDDVLAVYYQNPSATVAADRFSGPVLYPTARTPIGCCILDVDGDGKNDVVVSCRGANTLNVFLQR